MSISLGAHDHKQTNSPTTAATTTGVTTQASGSTFIAVLIWSAAETFSSITDSKANTWTLVDSEFSTSFGGKCRIYKCENGIGGATHTVTLHTATAADSDIYFVEILGAATASAVDQVASWAEDAATPFLSPLTGTTTQANELVFAAYTTNTPSGTETVNWTANGFTAIDNDGNSAGITGAMGYKIVAATGAYQASITSSVATGTAAITITVKEALTGPVPASGSLALTGNAPVVTVGVGRAVGVGALAFTGNAPQVITLGALKPGTAALALSGNAPNVFASIKITPSAGTLALTGLTPGISSPRGIVPQVGTLTLTGNVSPQTLTVPPSPAGSMGLTGNAPVVQQGSARVTSAGTISLSGNAAQVTQQILIVPAAGALALTGIAPSLTAPVRISPQTGALALTGAQASLSLPGQRVPNTGSAALIGFAPSVLASVSISTPAGSLAIVGNAPTLTQQNTRAPVVGNLAFTGQPAQVQVSGAIQPQIAALAFTGTQPGLAIGGPTTVQPLTGSLSLSGQTPTVVVAPLIPIPSSGQATTVYGPMTTTVNA